MRVATYLADQNPHRDRSRGITRLTRDLLGALCEQGVQILPVTSASSFEWDGLPGETVRLPIATDRLPLRVFVDTFHRAWPAVWRLPVDCWFYPKGFLPWVMPFDVPNVPLVPDAILVHYADRYPEFMGRATLVYLLSQLEHTLKRATAVVTISHHARGQLEAYCERRKIRSPPIHVAYPASDYESYLCEQPRAAPKGDYVVHLAATAPHKRTLALLQWWRLLQARGRPLPELLLVGGMTTDAQQLAARLPSVRAQPSLPEPEFRSTVAAARALLMPSEIEGFGLPVLEGYYLGTAGVYPVGTAMDEYMTPVSMVGRFDASDPDDFARALDDVMALDAGAIWQTATALHKRHAQRVFGQRVREILTSCQPAR